MDHEPWAADLAASSAMETDAADPGQQPPLRAPPLPTPLQPPAPRRSGREVKSTGVWIDGFYVKKSNMYDLEGGERGVASEGASPSEKSLFRLLKKIQPSERSCSQSRK